MKVKFLLFGLLFTFQSVFAQGDPHFVELIDGLEDPVSISNAGDGSNRLFIIERAGKIKIYDLATKTLVPTPFLDITDRVESNAGEEGLLGLAFDPDFKNNGFFYVNYIGPIGQAGLPDSTRVSRFELTADPNISDPNSEYLILSFEQPYNNHNGGDLHFGSDEFLYISTGDGGAAGDPQNRAQNLQSFHGKILRLDILTDQFPNDPLKNYSIPTSNPFTSDPDAYDEIFHYGLRNPWRFTFDNETGDMFIGDVGQYNWEEISYAPGGSSGLNFGWKCLEGNNMFSSSGYCTDGISNNLFTEPIFDYHHDDGNSVTGGQMYRGNLFANFYGKYFFIDFGTDKLYSLEQNMTGDWTAIDHLNDNNITKVSSFGESENGEIYAVSYTQGKLLRLIDLSVCPLMLSISDSSQSEYGSVNSINSTAIISGHDAVSYFANEEISLLPGFSTPATITFNALLEVCGNP